MKSNALTLLILLGVTGSVFANQAIDQTTNHSRATEPRNITASNAGNFQPSNEQSSAKDSHASKAKSLKERERERKGLPRYWN